MGRAGTELPIFDLRNTSPLLHAHSVLLWVTRYRIAPPRYVCLSLNRRHWLSGLENDVEGYDRALTSRHSVISSARASSNSGTSM